MGILRWKFATWIIYANDKYSYVGCLRDEEDFLVGLLKYHEYKAEKYISSIVQ
jgi:hypothetical protein